MIHKRLAKKHPHLNCTKNFMAPYLTSTKHVLMKRKNCDDSFEEEKNTHCTAINVYWFGWRTLYIEGVHLGVRCRYAEGDSVTRSPEVVLIIPRTAHVRTRNEGSTLSRPRFIGHYLVFNPVRAAGGGRSPPIQFLFYFYPLVRAICSTHHLSFRLFVLYAVGYSVTPFFIFVWTSVLDAL